MGKQIIGNRFQFDFTYQGQRVRGSVSCETILALINGAEATEAARNIGSQGTIAFSRFVDEHYLPRHAKPNKQPAAYESDLCSVVCLKGFFGEKPVHLVAKTAREEFKQLRLVGALSKKGKPCSNNTVNRELSCLNQIMEYAAAMDFLKANPLAGLKRLPPVHRQKFWLTKEHFEQKLLPAARAYEGGRYLDLIEFFAFTGARRNEALAFHKDDLNWAREEIRLATLKKRGGRKAERYLSVRDIGPRLRGVLERLRPHPVSGYFFAARSGKPWQGHNIDRMFDRVRDRAGLPEYTVHSLRHTYAMHRAMTKITFRQLQIELGHSSPQSIQSYLDQAARFDSGESIFTAASPA